MGPTRTKKDAWVFTFDVKGHLLWEHSFGGEHDDIAYAVLPTPDGEYIVAGQTTAKNSYTPEAWIFKLNAQGQTVWEHIFDGRIARTIQTTADGSYLIAGKTATEGDVWVCKFTIQ